jgi:23S rRNA (uracil1939-C5)-methyltransferase
MEFKKNQEIILKIDDLGNDGEGIGHVDGYALFVKDALPGEKIRAKILKCKKNYGFAKLLEILPESPELAENGEAVSKGSAGVGRVTPRCPVAKQCGGCTLQHLSYEKQLAFKEKKVRDCLERIGGVDLGKVEWLPILGMDRKGDEEPWHDEPKHDEPRDGEQWHGVPKHDEPRDGVPWHGEPWHYRNKAQFPVRNYVDSDGRKIPATGFYAGRTHSMIPVTDCAIQHPCMQHILEEVLAWMKEEHVTAYDEADGSGLVRHIYIRCGYHTGEIMVCLVVNAKMSISQSGELKELNTRELPLESLDVLVEKLTKIQGLQSICLNENTEKTNVILGKKTAFLWGKTVIEDTIGDIRYQISPQSFYQVNPVQTEKLYRTVLEFADLTGNEIVWDLYCGIGTISLFLAKKAKQVYGVEIVPEAIENAKANARRNGIENAVFFCGAAEDVAPRILSKQADSGHADVIVVDPPRKGCDAVLLDTIRDMNPTRIVYVSCNPATLARDVKRLGESGYVVRKVRPCDMFPMGGHVESVCLLSKKP